MVIVRYIVTDVDRSVAFYQEHLGFTIQKLVGSAIAHMVKGDLSLWLSGPTSSAGRPLASGTMPAPGGWNRFLLKVENLDTRLAQFTRAGVKLRGGIVAGSGGRTLIIEDPDGNPIELFELASPAERVGLGHVITNE
jgi:glyoxylase I family protein